MPRSRSAGRGFFQEMQNTVCPAPTRYRISELCGLRVEDVVLHDPGRHDQDRLRVDLRRVAGAYWMSSIRRLRNTTLPGVTATVFPGRNASAPTGGRPACDPLPVRDPVQPALVQVEPARLDRPPQHLGVGEREVARRDDVEELPRDERHDVLVVAGHAAHLGRGVVPPLLHEQERLVDRVERPALPVRVVEAPVLLERLDARLGVSRRRGAGGTSRAGAPCAAPSARDAPAWRATA